MSVLDDLRKTRDMILKQTGLRILKPWDEMSPEEKTLELRKALYEYSQALFLIGATSDSVVETMKKLKKKCDKRTHNNENNLA